MDAFLMDILDEKGLCFMFLLMDFSENPQNVAYLWEV